MTFATGNNSYFHHVSVGNTEHALLPNTQLMSVWLRYTHQFLCVKFAQFYSQRIALEFSFWQYHNVSSIYGFHLSFSCTRSIKIMSCYKTKLFQWYINNARCTTPHPCRFAVLPNGQSNVSAIGKFQSPILCLRCMFSYYYLYMLSTVST